MNKVFLGVSDFYDNVFYGVEETIDDFCLKVLEYLEKNKSEDYYVTDYKFAQAEKDFWVVKFADYFRGVPDTNPFQLFTLNVYDITEQEFFVVPETEKQIYV